MKIQNNSIEVDELKQHKLIVGYEVYRSLADEEPKAVFCEKCGAERLPKFLDRSNGYMIPLFYSEVSDLQRCDTCHGSLLHGVN